jgi:hypothetical protein
MTMAASAFASPGNRPPRGAPHPLEFFGELRWLDDRPLLDTIEPYRRKILVDVLWTFGDDGAPIYSMVLAGRAKKNWKTSDLVLDFSHGRAAPGTTPISWRTTKGRPPTTSRWSRNCLSPIRR